MQRRLTLLVFACAVAVGCTRPESRLQVERADTGAGFLFVSQGYDIFPARRPEGEAWREQDLRARLVSAGVCGDGYEIVERSESVTQGRVFDGRILTVTYRGHCGGMPAAAPAEPTAPLILPPVETLPLAPQAGPGDSTPAPLVPLDPAAG
ncbi:MAG: hypothetical protein ACK4QW_02575 [Alphaproteobacteria bacterium]